MASEQFSNMMALFESLCDLSAAEQADRLAQLGDARLVVQVRQMLSHDAGDASALEHPSRLRVSLDTRLPTPPEAPIPLGAFVLEAPLGQGGMGVVWRGRHLASDTPVAVKVMRAEAAQQVGFVEAFTREVHTVARLAHPGIVQVLDHGLLEADHPEVGLHAGSPYLVMELAEGTLAQAAPLAWDALRPILGALLDALAHAHARDALHRDIKPANVLHVRERWVLADFGLAHTLDQDEAPVEGGTLAFMAPEQLRGQWRDYGPGTDLYALGATARALLDPEAALPPAADVWLDRLQRRDRTAPPFPDAAAALSALPVPDHADDDAALWTLAALRTGADWPRPPVPPTSLRLMDAGLGLYGLRALPLVGRDAQQARAAQGYAIVAAEWEAMEPPALTREADAAAQRCHLTAGAP